MNKFRINQQHEGNKKDSRREDWGVFVPRDFCPGKNKMFIEKDVLYDALIMAAVRKFKHN